MEKILEIIGGTKNQYEHILLANYMNWCKIYCNGSDRIIQKIMLDQNINRWYITELKKLDTKFLQENAAVLNSKYINHKLMKQKYYTAIQLIFTIYPKPLLEKYETKKTQFTTFNHN
jgi:hypothetical protein